MGMVYFMENPVLKWMITGGTMDWKAPNDGHIVDGTNPNGSKIMTHIQFKCPIVKYIVEHLGGMVKICKNRWVHTYTRGSSSMSCFGLGMVYDLGLPHDISRMCRIWICQQTEGFCLACLAACYVWYILEQQTRFLQHLQLLQLQLLLRGRTNSRVAGSLETKPHGRNIFFPSLGVLQVRNGGRTNSGFVWTYRVPPNLMIDHHFSQQDCNLAQN